MRPPVPPGGVAAPPGRPTLLFDVDCRFCRQWIARWREATGERVDYRAWQEAGSPHPEIPEELLRRSVVLVLPDGGVRSGAHAVFTALSLGPSGGRALALYERLPLFAAASERSYAFIAGHREAAARVTRWLWGRDVRRPCWSIATAIHLRLLGLTYLIALVSLWIQIEGLIGSRGILPVASFLESAGTPARRGWWLYPTLCWLDPGDATLHLLCGAGVLLSLLAIAGVAQTASFVLLWLFYLSLTVAGQDFLGFQWDNLLLEAGLIAPLLAPAVWRSRLREPPAPARLPFELCRWLLFRLMLSSGAVKLASGDPAWRGLTALEHHYETQPLPPWTAWYAHQLPAGFHAASVALMFAIELVAPCLLYAPRRLRHAAALTLAGLQLIIALTGNYGFFNLLSISLCLLMLDDAFGPWRRERAARRSRLPRPVTWGIAAVAGLIFLVGAVRLAETFRTPVPWPRPIERLATLVAPLRSVNRYGLFAVMTTTRHEIVVEGSRDGTTWSAYRFRWKPDDPETRPRFVSPHMPRLDWQMWFAALGTYRQNPWFTLFLARILDGSPEVLALMAANPFPDAPPRYVRALLYDYRFTRPGAAEAPGAWWRREPLGPYTPPLSLRSRPPGG